MAQEKAPRTFEEYNFQEFLKMKEENETLEIENKELKEMNELDNETHKKLFDLVKSALAMSNIEVEGDLVSVYICERYIGLFDKEREVSFSKNGEQERSCLKALAELITLFHDIPNREE